MEKKKKSEELVAPTYTSQYDDAISRLTESINNRGSYSMTSGDDALMSIYADRYMQQGKQAMKDTVGQSAALTGGYGNSYAHNVGQQAYDKYLQSMGDITLDIYDRSYKRYLDEGEMLEEELGRLTDEEQKDYERYLDALNQYNKDRDYYYEAEQNEEKAEREGRESAYDILYEIILASGYIPTDEELEAGGMTREAAEALRAAYLNKLSGKGGSSGSGSSSGKGGSSSGDTGSSDNRYSAILAQCNALKTAGSSSETIASRINAAYSSGYITEAQRSFLLSNFC